MSVRSEIATKALSWFEAQEAESGNSLIAGN